MCPSVLNLWIVEKKSKLLNTELVIGILYIIVIEELVLNINR